MRDFSCRKMMCFLISMNVLCLPSSSAFAAKAVDLQHQSLSMLRAMLPSSQLSAATPPPGMREINRDVDFNHTLHIRAQQMYRGYPVFGGDVVIHRRNTQRSDANMSLAASLSALTTSNGIIYQNLDGDLKQTPGYIFKNEQAQKAVSHAASLYQQGGRATTILSEKQSKLMVYVDKNQQAHWAYLVSFFARIPKTMPAKPTYILDAISFQVYQQWDDVQTLDIVSAGGVGGNKKTGMIIYDGGKGKDRAASFTVSRDAASEICYLRDAVALVRDGRKDLDIVQFGCPTKMSKHNNLYWDSGSGLPEQEEFNGPDSINGAYAPSNDAYYAAHIVKEMYSNVYHVEPVVNFDTRQPIKIMIFSHDGAYVNAAWMGKFMTLGDGDDHYYPLATLDVIAHEISHGFTMNHGVLIYFGQSGAINESFSDMAAQAAEFYARGENDWKIGGMLNKDKDTALRYMNDPKLDCEEAQIPGETCSIDHVKDYKDSTNVHFSSGIFNKAFYLISTAANWSVEKAFRVMVHANMHYWTYDTDFSHAACGVLQAAQDYAKDHPGDYDTSAVVQAFNAVGIETSAC